MLININQYLTHILLSHVFRRKDGYSYTGGWKHFRLLECRTLWDKPEQSIHASAKPRSQELEKCLVSTVCACASSSVTFIKKAEWTWNSYMCNNGLAVSIGSLHKHIKKVLYCRAEMKVIISPLNLRLCIKPSKPPNLRSSRLLTCCL